MDLVQKAVRELFDLTDRLRFEQIFNQMRGLLFDGFEQTPISRLENSRAFVGAWPAGSGRPPVPSPNERLREASGLSPTSTIRSIEGSSIRRNAASLVRPERSGPRYSQTKKTTFKDTITKKTNFTSKFDDLFDKLGHWAAWCFSGVFYPLNRIKTIGRSFRRRVHRLLQSPRAPAARDPEHGCMKLEVVA